MLQTMFHSLHHSNTPSLAPPFCLSPHPRIVPLIALEKQLCAQGPPVAQNAYMSEKTAVYADKSHVTEPERWY
jgi:hypothetical protein